MATLTVTSDNVAYGATMTAANTTRGTGVAAVALEKGQIAYPLDGKYYLADADAIGTAPKGLVYVLTKAAVDVTFEFVSKGYINPGATIVVNAAYWLSATAGGIDDALTSAKFNQPLAWGVTTSEIYFNPLYIGTASA